MATHEHCQSDELLDAISPITGNRVRVNLSYGKVYVPHDMDVGLARKLGAELPDLWEKQASATGNGWKSSHDMRAAYYAFAAIRTLDDFMSAVDQMLGTVAEAKEPRAQVYRALLWLTRLWAHGLVAIPPKWTCEYKINCPVSDFTVAHHRAWLEDIAAAVSMKSERERACSGLGAEDRHDGGRRAGVGGFDARDNRGNGARGNGHAYAWHHQGHLGCPGGTLRCGGRDAQGLGVEEIPHQEEIRCGVCLGNGAGPDP